MQCTAHRHIHQSQKRLGRGHTHDRVFTHMRTPLIDGLGHATVVQDGVSFSLSNAVLIAKMLVYFSSACSTEAVGIVHNPPRSL